MHVDRTSMKWIISLIGLLATASFLAGCGGGGGGGGGGGVTTYTYSGVVQDQSGNPVSSLTVTFDADTYNSTTSSTGAFTISGVPASAEKATNVLNVTNASGVNEGSYPITTADTSMSGIVIKIGPPPPPPLAKGR